MKSSTIPQAPKPKAIPTPRVKSKIPPQPLSSSLAASKSSLKSSLSSVTPKRNPLSSPMSDPFDGVASDEIVTMRFQVFGKVQGVFFRNHTAAKGNELGLVGVVRNNKDVERSVQGFVQGPLGRVNEFKLWVSTVGSPKSTITRCDCTRVVNDAYKLGAGFVVDRS